MTPPTTGKTRAAAPENVLAGAIWGTLQSPNEVDRNLENANVVDGLFAIARGLHHVARATERANGLSREDKGQ
jgi:hypothetical protein